MEFSYLIFTREKEREVKCCAGVIVREREFEGRDENETVRERNKRGWGKVIRRRKNYREERELDK